MKAIAGNDAIKVNATNKVHKTRPEGDKREELNLDIVSVSVGIPPTTTASAMSNLAPSSSFRSFKGTSTPASS